MTGYITRPVTVASVDRDGRKTIETAPAGALVHVGRVRDNEGTCEIRLPGTLLAQRVHLADIEPA